MANQINNKVKQHLLINNHQKHLKSQKIISLKKINHQIIKITIEIIIKKNPNHQFHFQIKQ